MSSERGNGSRTRAQKHKNRTVFKNDLHDKTDLQKRLNAMSIYEVCQHCKSVIEWKIKYKKYKPLSQPKTCTRCQQRNIRKAYHIYCRDCALETRVCAKCGKSADEVDIEPPQPTPEEQLKLKVEMERLIKTFSERKRRAFLRYMEKGKQDDLGAQVANAAARTNDDDDDRGEDKEDGPEQIKRIPYSRDELLQKIERLKLNQNENDDDFSCGSDSEDCEDSGDDGSDHP